MSFNYPVLFHRSILKTSVPLSSQTCRIFLFGFFCGGLLRFVKTDMIDFRVHLSYCNHQTSFCLKYKSIVNLWSGAFMFWMPVVNVILMSDFCCIVEQIKKQICFSHLDSCPSSQYFYAFYNRLLHLQDSRNADMNILKPWLYDIYAYSFYRICAKHFYWFELSYIFWSASYSVKWVRMTSGIKLLWWNSKTQKYFNLPVKSSITQASSFPYCSCSCRPRLAGWICFVFFNQAGTF